jgi:hypothetical protein
MAWSRIHSTVLGVAILMAWISGVRRLVVGGVHEPGRLEQQQPQLLDPHARLGDPIADDALLCERLAEDHPRVGPRTHQIRWPVRRRQ